MVFVNLKLKDSYDLVMTGKMLPRSQEQLIVMNNIQDDIDSFFDKTKENDPGLTPMILWVEMVKMGLANGYLKIEDDADLANVAIFDLALRKTLVVTPTICL